MFIGDLTKKIIALNGVFLLLLSLCRAAFFQYYAAGGAGGDIAAAGMFIVGMRFDLSVIGTINIPVAAGMCLVYLISRPGVVRAWVAFLRHYYGAAYSGVFLVSMVDFAYYGYFNERINLSNYKFLVDNLKGVAASVGFIYNIPLVLAGGVAIVAAVTLLSRHVMKLREEDPSPAPKRSLQAAWLGCLLAITFLAQRGFSVGGIRFSDAEISNNALVNAAGHNGVFTLMESLKMTLSYPGGRGGAGNEYTVSTALEKFLGRNRDKLANGYVANLLQRTAKNEERERMKPNVVVILREGFGSDLLKYNSASFNVLGKLKEHFEQDCVFYNFLPSDFSTYGSMEALLCGVYRRKNAPYLLYGTAKSAAGYPTGAPLLFRRSGYATTFIVSDFQTYRNLDAIGFDSVRYLREELPTDRAAATGIYCDDNGLYDEFLYRAVYEQLGRATERPQFIFALTSTNHTPFQPLPPSYSAEPLSVPPELREKMFDATREYCFTTYRYANDQLADLIGKVKASPLRDTTIIAAVGDHPMKNVFRKSENDYFDYYGVPFYLYIPRALKPVAVDTTVVGCHTDIMPTLYNLSLSDREFVSLGYDLLDAAAPHMAVESAYTMAASSHGAADFGSERCFTHRGASPVYLHGLSDPLPYRKLISRARAGMRLTSFLLENQ